MHIKSKFIKDTDFEGELSITDYCLGFDENGPLRHLNIHWNAIVHFCKTLDAAQDRAKQAIARALSNASPEDPEGCFILEGELECATLADETLTKATIFIVLCSFKEFALKELYRQLRDEEPLPAKGAFRHIQEVFTRRGIWPNDCQSGGQLSQSAYDSVRNNFAHGDWAALKEELPKLELHDEFGEVISFLFKILEGMRANGLSL
jgi:hypothetical protein